MRFEYFGLYFLYALYDIVCFAAKAVQLYKIRK